MRFGVAVEQSGPRFSAVETVGLLAVCVALFLLAFSGRTAASPVAAGKSTVHPLHVETGGVRQHAGPEVRSIEVGLEGVLYPRGHYAFYWFQWGPTSRYGHLTKPEVDEGLGAFGGEGVMETVYHLHAHRVYHYRVVGKNAAGKAFGHDRTFKTKGPIH